MKHHKIHRFLAAALSGVALSSFAQGSIDASVSSSAAGVFQSSWMHSDVPQAWARGFRGQGVSITVIDDFNGASRIGGRLDGQTRSLRHGEWTALEAGLLAPSAGVFRQDFGNSSAVAFKPGLDVLNLSYAMFAARGYNVSQIRWSARENSIIAAARGGTAVVVKAAGNDAVAVMAANRNGQMDYLNQALRGAQTGIYVGALDRHGTPAARASLASYSNTPGTDTVVQNQFLVVGVPGSQTGLYGTSFAAPVVSAYAAILGSKFTAATPKAITTQLLSTARKDTINGYNAARHGVGEASLTRALAPASIR